MLHCIKSKTSTGEILKEKDITDNWWQTYHDICIFDWALAPKCYDSEGNSTRYWKECLPQGKANIVNNNAKKMVCIDRQRDITVTLIRK